ncbi:MAG: RNB domain-containing ribonuclease [Pirellulales bacterium]
MRIRTDKSCEQVLQYGFRSISEQFHLPRGFSDQVDAEAKLAAARLSDPSKWLGGPRADMTQLPFVTLDPASSTDLDQAFCIEADGPELVLHYALADVAALIDDGGLIDQEAWSRGVTIYGLAEKVPLYPVQISQHAASLLPDGPRPAFLVDVAIDVAGQLNLRSIQRVICASRAKLAYDSVNVEQLSEFREFARRMELNEIKRGAMRFQFPEQEVQADVNSPGGVRLDLRTPLESEQMNATLSLSVNLAIAELFLEAKTGLFRVMEEPEERAIKRLRLEAHALGIDWPESQSLHSLMQSLDQEKMDHKRFLLTARRAGGRAGYAEFNDARKPWHFAVAASYVHATAPMRRLADRYVLELAFRIANQLPVTDALTDALHRLPPLMDRTGSRAKSVAQAVIDLIEAVSLQHRIGEILDAEVVDADSKIVQTVDSAIRSRVAALPPVRDGDTVKVRIDAADPVQRKILLTAV